MASSIIKYITAVILFLTVFSLTATPVYASDTGYHEDPGIAKQIFSGIALLHYYSGSLDTVLQKDPEATEAALEKMPFANIPQELDTATGDFNVFSIALSHSIADLFSLWQEENKLLSQYQLDEADKLGERIAEGLPQARDQLTQLTSAVESIGIYLEISSASPRGELRLTYDEIIEKLRQLGDILDLLSRPLFDIGVLRSADQDKLAELLGITPEQLQELLNPENIDELLDLLRSADLDKLAELLGITPEQLQELLNPENIDELLDLLRSADLDKLADTLGITPEQLQELLKPENSKELNDLLQDIFEPTLLTLVIEPLEAFVGDEVDFKVELTSNGQPLGNRDVDIIYNSTRYSTVTTDTQGCYQGQLQIPYRYLPELEVQAIYYPENQDTGTYLGSVSQLITINVKYYTAGLELSVTGKTYPGTTPSLYGIFDYGQFPPKEEREILCYLDDVEIDDLNVPISFEVPVNLASDIEPGNHTLTVSSPADGRYAPVISGYIIEVTRAATILDFNISGIAIIPGTIDLTGKIYSEIGPLENASITFKMDKSVVQIYSSPDGTFTGRLETGMGFSLLGLQQMLIQVQPGEPWNAPLTATRNIFVINVVNCGILLVILAVIILFVRAKLKKWYGLHSPAPVRPITNMPTAPEPVFAAAADTALKIVIPDNDSLLTTIIKQYILSLKIVQRITRMVLKPQQTLREYATDSGRELGPLSKVFFEFTCFIEMLIYSNHKPVNEDVGKSRQLSHSIKKAGFYDEKV